METKGGEGREAQEGDMEKANGRIGERKSVPAHATTGLGGDGLSCRAVQKKAG